MTTPPDLTQDPLVQPDPSTEVRQRLSPLILRLLPRAHSYPRSVD
jgi:hypothetical protein